MSKNNLEAVVFAKGEYTVNTKNGTVKVIAPRDIVLGEVIHPFAQLFKEGK